MARKGNFSKLILLFLFLFNLDSFSHADGVKVNCKPKPRFFAVIDTGVSTWKVSCYNQADTLKKFLDNLLCICPADSFTYKDVNYFNNETVESWNSKFEKSNLTKSEREDVLEYLEKNKKYQNCLNPSFSIEKLKKQKYVITSENAD